LVQQYIVSYLGRFADDHAGSVIDKESSAYCSAGMYFYRCQETGKVRKKPGGKFYPVRPEEMGYAVKSQRMKARITEKHLEHASCGRVFGENCPDIFFQ
jgi:hypothetical protein